MGHVDAVEDPLRGSLREGDAKKPMAGILPKPALLGRCHGITASEQGSIAEDEDSDASSNLSPHWSSSDSDSASEEGEAEVVEGRSDVEGFLANWIAVYGEAASNMTLFERSVLMPNIKSIEVSGSRGAKEMIVVEDIKNIRYLRRAFPSSFRASFFSSRMERGAGRHSTRPPRSE
jgi:hypothetical protein